MQISGRLPDQESSGLLGSLLALSFGLGPGGEGREVEDGLVKPLFSAAVWTFAAST